MFVWAYRFVEYKSREYDRLLRNGWELFNIDRDKTATVRKRRVKKEQKNEDAHTS